MTAGSITLEATPRDKAKRARDLRAERRVPCVLYGFSTDNQPIDCDYQEFHKVYVEAGESTVIDLKVGSKTVPVLIHEMHFDPVSGNYEHVDFFAVNMKKEITAQVPIRTTGEAPGVKDQGGILVQNRDSLTVKCLPKDLPQSFEVDLSPLENFHDTITVAAITLPDGVAVMEDEEEILLTVQPPRAEEEIAPAAEEGEGEGEEGAEGETAEGEAAAGDEAKKEGEGEKAEGGEEKKDA